MSIQACSVSQTEWGSLVVLPYVQGVFESIRRILLPLQVRVCFKPVRTLKQLLSKPKDHIPDLQKSSVVYKIPCAECPASYVSQTGQRLDLHLEEHKKAVRIADFNSSALAEHAWTNAHSVD